jgi:hypothetical protein
MTKPQTLDEKIQESIKEVDKKMELIDSKNKLRVKKFKEFFREMNWVLAKRKLGIATTQEFLVGSYEDDEKAIHATIRPSKRMQVKEFLKNVDDFGQKNTDERKNSMNFGRSAHVVVGDNLIKEIKKISKKIKKTKTQTIDL